MTYLVCELEVADNMGSSTPTEDACLQGFQVSSFWSRAGRGGLRAATSKRLPFQLVAKEANCARGVLFKICPRTTCDRLAQSCRNILILSPAAGDSVDSSAARLVPRQQTGRSAAEVLQQCEELWSRQTSEAPG
eukprot:s3868_g8.t1